MENETSYRIVHVSSAEEITEIIKEIPDVKASLERKVDLSAYVQKMALHAENFLLLENDIMQAFASVYMNDDIGYTAFITLIACTQKSRNKGFGSKMLRHVFRAAADAGMHRLRLEVDRENMPAILFYKKHGMIIVGESTHGYYMEVSL